jgi:hypothetical protein
MKRRLQVTIPDRGGWIYASLALMVLAAALRLYYYLPMIMEPAMKMLHLWLPVAAAGVFVLAFALGGAWKKPGALLSVVLGVVFFILKARNFAPLHRTLCTILYVLVLVLFSITLLGLLPTKKLLYPLFGLPLAYHILVEDTRYYFFADPPVPVRQWIPELSVLCIMAALLCLSIALQTEKA